MKNTGGGGGGGLEILNSSWLKIHVEWKMPRGKTPPKNDGEACQKFLKNTLKGTRILFDGCGSNGFSSLRGPNYKTTRVTL